jgi:hypothetical protein
MRRATAVLTVIFLGASPLPADDGGKIFELKDPSGDDHGDGSLVYPLRDDLQPGDLDLLSFAAEGSERGTWFEVAFARRITPTGRRTIDIGGGSLDKVARFGFYTFNLDIYVDTDRVEGSGTKEALPGRRAAIEPASAWEKAICLTPRPFEAREELERILVRFARRDLKAKEGRVDPVRIKELESEIARDVEARVFFPTLIHVVGPKIRFFVPSSFLGGPAKASWGWVVAVSGSDLFQKLDVGAALRISEPDPDSLMILPIASGRHRDRFGGAREDDPLQPPLVDILVPPGKSQEKVLKDYDPGANRPVQLPAVVPGGN